MPRIEGETLDYTRSVVAANDGAERLLIDVHVQNVSLDDLSAEQLARTRVRGEIGKKARVALARNGGKIGVNQ